MFLPGTGPVGFFPGEFWFLYEYTGKEQWKTAAEKYTANLKGKKQMVALMIWDSKCIAVSVLVINSQRMHITKKSLFNRPKHYPPGSVLLPGLSIHGIIEPVGIPCDH